LIPDDQKLRVVARLSRV